MTSSFIDDLETLYCDELIYRAIVVCQDGYESDMQELLESYGHTVHRIESVINDNDTDYETLDSRILLICCSAFKTLIQHLNKRYGLQNISYNLIAFAYDIDEDVCNQLKTWVEGLNTNDIIII